MFLEVKLKMNYGMSVILPALLFTGITSKIVHVMLVNFLGVFIHKNSFSNNNII